MLDRRWIGGGRLGGVGGILVQPRLELCYLAFEFRNLAMEVPDDPMAEGHIVGKWGVVVTHAAWSSENRRSGQEQVWAEKGRKQRESAVSGVADLSPTWRCERLLFA